MSRKKKNQQIQEDDPINRFKDVMQYQTKKERESSGETMQTKAELTFTELHPGLAGVVNLTKKSMVPILTSVIFLTMVHCADKKFASGMFGKTLTGLIMRNIVDGLNEEDLKKWRIPPVWDKLDVESFVKAMKENFIMEPNGLNEQELKESGFEGFYIRSFDFTYVKPLIDRYKKVEKLYPKVHDIIFLNPEIKKMVRTKGLNAFYDSEKFRDLPDEDQRTLMEFKQDLYLLFLETGRMGKEMIHKAEDIYDHERPADYPKPAGIDRLKPNEKGEERYNVLFDKPAKQEFVIGVSVKKGKGHVLLATKMEKGSNHFILTLPKEIADYPITIYDPLSSQKILHLVHKFCRNNRTYIVMHDRIKASEDSTGKSSVSRPATSRPTRSGSINPASQPIIKSRPQTPALRHNKNR